MQFHLCKILGNATNSLLEEWITEGPKDPFEMRGVPIIFTWEGSLISVYNPSKHIPKHTFNMCNLFHYI